MLEKQINHTPCPQGTHSNKVIRNTDKLLQNMFYTEQNFIQDTMQMQKMTLEDPMKASNMALKERVLKYG